MKCLYYVYFDNNNNVTAITKLNTDKIEIKALGRKPKDLYNYSHQLLSNIFLLSEYINDFHVFESKTDINKKKGRRLNAIEREQLKLRAINQHDNGISTRAISANLGVSKSVIFDWLKKAY